MIEAADLGMQYSILNLDHLLLLLSFAMDNLDRISFIEIVPLKYFRSRISFSPVTK